VSFDRQSKLKEGDWMGVLVDLEEKEGRHGGSFFVNTVNGAQFGAGFKSGVIKPLVLKV
jgi:hypothetical protein